MSTNSEQLKEHVPLTHIPGKKIKLFEHQERTVNHLKENKRTFDSSDPGTGKTIGHLTAWGERRRNGGGKLLVLAPKSLLQSAWGNDINKLFPLEFHYSIATAKNRAEAFAENADIYITNSDAVKFLAQQKPSFFKDFDEIIIDESTAFKHHTSQRSKALWKIAKYFDYRRMLSGTPNSRSITDVWNQYRILDDGQRLGTAFTRFRSNVCEPVQVGPSANHIQWQDKPGIEVVVAGLVQDITIRHIFEECIDIPDNFVRTIDVELSPKHRRQYEELKKNAVLELQEDDVTAINAAALTTKLLQTCSGAAYGVNGKVDIDPARYELVIELVKEVEHSIVFFMWGHQKENLARLASKEGINYEIIDGSVPDRRRTQIVEAYQNGAFQTLFLHPKSAAHGLTLTKGTRTIWASPTYEPDVFKQGNHRVYRAGQQHKTETILIQATDTLEVDVYQKMNDKNQKMVNLLEMLT